MAASTPMWASRPERKARIRSSRSPGLAPGTGEAGASALAGPLGAASAGRAGVAAGFGWGAGAKISSTGETGASSWETS